MKRMICLLLGHKWSTKLCAGKPWFDIHYGCIQKCPRCGSVAIVLSHWVKRAWRQMWHKTTCRAFGHWYREVNGDVYEECRLCGAKNGWN